MFRPTANLLTCRAIWGVVVLWLCVIGAGVWAPMARAQMAAQGLELLCSGHGAPQWVLSPIGQAAHEDAATLPHSMDCPLCLPGLAPPPHASGLAQSVTPALGSWVQATVRLAPPALQWPPARGPPDDPATPG